MLNECDAWGGISVAHAACISGASWLILTGVSTLRRCALKVGCEFNIRCRILHPKW